MSLMTNLPDQRGRGSERSNPMAPARARNSRLRVGTKPPASLPGDGGPPSWTLADPRFGSHSGRVGCALKSIQPLQALGWPHGLESPWGQGRRLSARSLCWEPKRFVFGRKHCTIFGAAFAFERRATERARHPQPFSTAPLCGRYTSSLSGDTGRRRSFSAQRLHIEAIASFRPKPLARGRSFSSTRQRGAEGPCSILENARPRKPGNRVISTREGRS